MSNHGGNSAAIPDIGNGILSYSAVQFDPISANTLEEVDQNADRILQWMDRAVVGNPGCDIIVFPECCFQWMAPVNWLQVGIAINSVPIQKVCAKCKELSVWGIFNPWIKPEDGSDIENTAIVVNDQGEIAAQYIKMNPALSMEPTKPGRDMVVCNGPKGSKIAILICADALYPECWREAAFKGANVVFHISHWPIPGERMWKITNQAGAIFNSYYVIGVNSVCTDEGYSFFGGSMAVDPMGMITYEAPRGMPCVFSGAISPMAVDAARISGSNLLWTAYHRGACSADQKGVGLDLSDYTFYSAHSGEEN